MTSVITIQGLNHFFGQGEQQKQVLFNIELKIKAGEIVLMTGPSGSGKTTLLTLIGGLRLVQSGSLRFLGEELCKATQARLVQVRRQAGYIFQAHNLHESLTAQQNVRMGLEMHPQYSVEKMNKMAAEMLALVGLDHRLNHYPDQLSGGQKQRVAIARALVSRPKLLLADEPTAALDSKTGRDVVSLMQYLAQEQGCTILLVTHDSRILDIADRIIHMEDGVLKSDMIPAHQP
ncbi:MAG: ATP-binding cassette domain-containing protein [Symploca sp. SIO2E6]|nr:ATP-binding cassette domain-containing protein [Symploca sp. SIO2E6]